MPFKSSMLVRCMPWSAEGWEYVGPVDSGGDRTSLGLGLDRGYEELEEEEGSRGAPAPGVGCDLAREYGEFDRLDMRLHRPGMGARAHASRLFPVSEEDVEDLELGLEDGDEVHVQGEDGFHHGDMGAGIDLGIDLEGGYGFEQMHVGGGVGEEDGSGIRVAFEVESPSPIQRPHPRRLRTSSMYKHHHPVTELDLVSTPSPPVSTMPAHNHHYQHHHQRPLTPASLLCQPLSSPVPFSAISRPTTPTPLLDSSTSQSLSASANTNTSTGIHISDEHPPPPVYAELDVTLLPGGPYTTNPTSSCAGGEFTLAMDVDFLDSDVPFSVRRVKRGVCVFGEE